MSTVSWRLLACVAVAISGAVVAGGCGSAGSGKDSRESDGKEVQLFSADIPLDQIVLKLSGSEVQQVLDSVVQLAPMRHRPEVVKLLSDIWMNKRESHATLNWEILGGSRGRLAVAQVLGAWDRSDPQFREFILKALDGSEGLGKVDALVALVALGAVALLTS